MFFSLATNDVVRAPPLIRREMNRDCYTQICEYLSLRELGIFSMVSKAANDSAREIFVQRADSLGLFGTEPLTHEQKRQIVHLRLGTLRVITRLNQKGVLESFSHPRKGRCRFPGIKPAKGLLSRLRVFFNKKSINGLECSTFLEAMKDPSIALGLYKKSEFWQTKDIFPLHHYLRSAIRRTELLEESRNDLQNILIMAAGKGDEIGVKLLLELGATPAREFQYSDSLKPYGWIYPLLPTLDYIAYQHGIKAVECVLVEQTRREFGVSMLNKDQAEAVHISAVEQAEVGAARVKASMIHVSLPTGAF